MPRGPTQILGRIQDLVKGGSKKHPLTLSNCYSGTAEQGGHMPPNTFKRVTKKQCLVLLPPPPQYRVTNVPLQFQTCSAVPLIII